jgi:hypothetical protein
MQLERPWTRLRLEEELTRLANPAARADAQADGSAPVLCIGILDACKRYHVFRPWWFEQWARQIHDQGTASLRPREEDLPANTMTPEARRQLGMED